MRWSPFHAFLRSPEKGEDARVRNHGLHRAASGGTNLARRAATARDTGATTRRASPSSTARSTFARRKARLPAWRSCSRSSRCPARSASVTPGGQRTVLPVMPMPIPTRDPSGRVRRGPQRHHRELPVTPRGARRLRAPSFASETDTEMLAHLIAASTTVISSPQCASGGPGRGCLCARGR